MTDLAFPPETNAMRWERMCAEIHQWRGEMLDIFAKTERAVGQTLNAAGSKGQKLYLVGPKYDELEKLVGESGALAAVGRQVRGELAAFRAYDPLRSTLGHGELQATADATGKWVAIFRLLVFRSTGTESEVAVFSKNEAEALRDTLKARSAHLIGQLRNLQKQLS
ncbi:hypothetical protein [Sphingomonas sp.]|uniref:hypothetical protein n=1 Tax=Sphingomonas sp. TaxID=28214 RepID=UPI002DD6897C|nr:hypothetical protein [Sphingomonas sp.]